jgi:hypothetical protein
MWSMHKYFKPTCMHFLPHLSTRPRTKSTLSVIDFFFISFFSFFLLRLVLLLLGEPLRQVGLELLTRLGDGRGVLLAGRVQVLAVAAVVAVGQVVWLALRGREPHRRTLPGVVREIRVKHLCLFVRS